MITLRTTTTDDPVFRELEAMQVIEVMRRYDSDDPGPAVCGGLTAVVAEERAETKETDTDETEGSDGVARAAAPADTSVLGCVALSPLEPGVAEVKRVFVRDGARGRGVARWMLAEIERLAGEAGAGILKLEVGERQPEALALYLSEGWTRTDCYGYWKDSPLVICLQKALPGAPGAA